MKYALQITSVLLLSFFVLFACNNAPATPIPKDFLFDRALANSVKIKRLLTDGHALLPLDKTQRQDLYSYYQQIGFRSFYSRNTTGQTIQNNWLKTLSKHDYFGLPSARIISLDKKPNLIKELLLNFQIGTTFKDLDSGFIDLEKQKFKVKTWKKFPTAWLTKPLNTDSLLLSCGPADTNYRCMAQHLYHFADSAKLDTISFKLTTEKDNKVFAWQQLQIALIGLGYCAENSDSSDFRAALKAYQKKQGLNADGRIGTATVLAFAQSKQDQLYHAQISLDKLRQVAKKPTTFVAINLPSFELQFISNDTLRSIHRVIIGKIAHATPELSSKITRIVSLPFWRVPSSIAKNEILAVLKRDATYLEKEHMRIYGVGKKEIDPKTVRWKKIKNNTFPYLIEQDPGPWNSLGLIKFEFANQFSVYVHDTPNRALFGQKFRSFSHGCMRTEAPIELGKLMLNQDFIATRYNKVNGDSLQSLIDQQQHQKIPLLKAIPIFVAYYTVTADQKGLYFHLDLYQRERTLVALFRSGNNG